MGYTHYWEFNTLKKSKGQAKKREELYQKAIKDCNMIIKHWQKLHAKESDTDFMRLSGYSAHSKGYGGINLNGKQEYGHESFCLREHASQNRDFEFCKTARKPYDAIVVACLAVLKHRLGEFIHVSSDGSAYDWIEGVELAKKVTKLKIHNPIVPDILQEAK